MKKHVLASALGLLVGAGNLAVATPAKATLWLNYASDRDAWPYLGYFLWMPSDAQGEPVSIIAEDYTWNSGGNPEEIAWSLTPDPVGSGFWRLAPRYQRTGQNNVAGVAGGNMSNGTSLINWTSNGQYDQHWLPGPSIYDNRGALCYVFFNRKNMSKVMGVSGGSMINGQPVVVWDYFADIQAHPDQAWCAYTRNVWGQIVPQIPPPF